MKKHFIIFVLLAIFCFTLTGCAKVDYTFLNDGSKITQVFSVELDSELLTEKAINPLEIKTIINEKVLEYIAFYKITFESKVNHLMVSNEVSVATAKAIKEAVIIQDPIWLNNILTCQITYNSVKTVDKSINYLNIYYLFNTGELYPTVEESNIVYEGLLRKLSETEYSVFNSSAAIEYKEKVEEALNEKGIQLDGSQIKYSYTYGTQYRRIHSDADNISYDGTYYLHSWGLENAEEKITLYRLYANQWIWYAIAAGCGVVTVIVLMIVSAVKKKKMSQVEVEIISPRD